MMMNKQELIELLSNEMLIVSAFADKKGKLFNFLSTSHLSIDRNLCDITKEEMIVKIKEMYEEQNYKYILQDEIADILNESEELTISKETILNAEEIKTMWVKENMQTEENHDQTLNEGIVELKEALDKIALFKDVIGTLTKIVLFH